MHLNSVTSFLSLQAKGQKNFLSQNPFPETLVMDSKRIVALRDATERTAMSTAVILLTFSNVQGFIVPMDAQKLKGEQIKSSS